MKTRYPIKRLFVFFLVIFTATVSAASQGPTKARVENVTDDYFGTKVVDPYRWLEDMKSKEVQDWMREQADFANSYLVKLPMRDELFKRLTEVSSASSAVSNVRRCGNLFFYRRRGPDEPAFKLYVREGLNGIERVLVDPAKVINDGKRYSIGSWNPSFDGKYLSYSIAAGGSEDGELRIVDVATGRMLPDVIDRVRGNAGEWLPDGKSFVYTRLQKITPDSDQVDKNKNRRVYRHILGENADKDKAIFGNEVSPDIDIAPELGAYAETEPSWKFVIASINSGVTPESAFYVAATDDLGKTPVPWRKIASFEDKVSGVSVRGDDLYLTTFKNAPRFKVVRTRLSKPDLADAETIFSGGDAVVNYATAQPDALYVNSLDGGLFRIDRVDYKTRRAEPVPLPYPGAASIDATEMSMDGIYYSIVSWTKSSAHFKYDPKSKRSEPTNLVPPNPVDMSGVEFVNVKAKSHDGVEVPLVIIHKKGLKLDGKNPTLMDGYGAYGVENVSPFFFTSGLPWIEHGGIYVFTGVRGGGEYGEEWHLAGKGKTKPNTWKDFIACAEYLIKEGYTSSRHLAIAGGSAGGILISNSITTRPDLFRAAIIGVGVNNPLRLELTANGPPNVPELGSVTTEEGFNALLEMDGYHKVKNGVKYPAVMLTHGVNDTRVDAWMSAKMAARLQAATSSGKPVLLRLDYDAGHGLGSTKEQSNRETADIYAFLFDQLK